MIVELWKEHHPTSPEAAQHLLDEVHTLLQNAEHTRSIARSHVLLHESFPVDIRHNSKIFREQLAPWATQQLALLEHPK